MNLKDKTAVITGASDGIGKEVALKLAKEAVNLILIARNEERLKEVQNECFELGSPKIECYICDISNSEAVEKAVRKILNDFGSVDILLNIAGVWHLPRDLEEIMTSEIVSVINTNLVGLIQITSLILPVLKSRLEAAIINVSSSSGVTVKKGQSVYSASKWGVTGFTEVLKEDLKETNVRVAGIYQGGTKTNMFKKGNDNRDVSKFTKPSDLADVILFMLSRPPQIWLHDVRIVY